MLNEGSVKTEELWHINRNGQPFPTLMNFTLFNDDSDNVYISASVLDISDRMMAERALLWSEKNLTIRNRIANALLTSPENSYDEVLEAIIDVLQSKDGFLGLEEFNQDLRLVSGVFNNQYLAASQSDNEIMQPTWMSLWQKAIETQQSQLVNSPKPNPIIHRSLTTPISINNRIIGAISVCNKLTDYDLKDVAILESIASYLAPVLNARIQHHQQNQINRKLEEQLQQAQKMETIGKLTGGIAHDFNNLLQAILGYTEILQNEIPKDWEAYKEVNEIFFAATRASNLTSQLLTFSRRQKLNPQPIDLNHLILNLLNLIQRMIGEHISIHFNPASQIDLVDADKSQLEQVILNICINARDAMPDEGQIDISTKLVTIDNDYTLLHPEAAPGNYMQIKISDNGQGIEKELLNRIFEPFFSTKSQGTGLGLSMVFGIIKQHQGFIEVQSEIGKGTSFDLYLPITEKSATVVVKPITSNILSGTEKILYAEDEPIVRQFTSKILTRAGYKLIIASNGDEVCDTIQ